MYFVYILKCRDNSLYTGYTTDIERRLRQHNGEEKGGAKYTAGRAPVELVWNETYETESEAKKREAEIKKLTKKEKEALIHG